MPKEDYAASAATPLHRGGLGGRAGAMAGASSGSLLTVKGAAAEHQPRSWLTEKVPFLRTRRGKVITVILILLIIGGGLAGLAALPKRHSEDSVSGFNGITSDAYFYGQSPAVYPSPNMVGTGVWSDAYTKAQNLVGKMTLAEKLTLTHGSTTSGTGCNGFIPPIARVNFTGMCLSDGPNGLRNTDFVSSWPSGIHVGASWNKRLARDRGKGLGVEFRIKGVNILLGPVVGPVGRVVLGGRNWEGFSVDPYLAGSLVTETVLAIQSVGVITSTKHFIGNEQETNRNPIGDVESISSNIDDRTMHELYLWPFQDAVKAGTGNIMCSYQRINNSYGCANSKTLNGLLKTELGFQGFVVSDWGAQHEGVSTALAGMDMAMPGLEQWGPHLETAVKNGSVPESRVNDMVTRIIASWYRMGQDHDFPPPGIGMPAALTQAHKIVDARAIPSRLTLVDGAVEGHVLVKNTNKSLPLKKPRLLSLFGYSARNPNQNSPGGSASPWALGVTSYNATQFQEGFLFNNAPTPESRRVLSPIAINGTLYSGGGSGATSQSLTLSPFDGIVQQAYEDNTMLFWEFVTANPTIHPGSDACLVFGNAFATESLDRPSLRDDYTDGLIKHVADRCANTIVVLHNAGVRLVDQFIDHPNVTAVVFAHLPGEMSGKALVKVLYALNGTNPSGRLPYTVARNESHYPVVGPDFEEGGSGMFAKFPQSNFSEGVFVDYRWFDEMGIKPRYEFGFGLSYTEFGYSGLVVEKAGGGNNATSFGEFPAGEIREGGQEDLWDIIVRVYADVQNKGDADGMEVAQLYVGFPSSSSPVAAEEGGGEKGEVEYVDMRGQRKAPVRQLRGFEKPLIMAGQTVGVEFSLTRRDLSVWDVERQAWRLDRGVYTVSVGGSSRNLPLVGNFTI